jgi:hypothetical protein
MPHRFRESELRPELRTPEANWLLAQLLDLQAGRIRILERVHRKMGPGITFLDATINLHVFVMRKRGTRQQQLIESLEAPRRTIRDGLERLQFADLIVRNGRGLYYPTPKTAQSANEIFPITLGEVRRLCDAYSSYRDAWKNGTNGA